MKYITKVDNLHIVEVSGENRQISEVSGRYEYKGMKMFQYNSSISSKNHMALSEILLFVEVCKLIQEKRKENTNDKRTSTDGSL